jgi:AcrR family transcriptional regulator
VVSEKPIPRRAVRTQETRDALLGAARDVLRKGGYANATVAGIAKKARRAHGTFYLYFPNKEAVYAVLLDEMWEDLKAQGRAIWQADEPVLSLIATIRRFIVAYEENLDLWELAEDMSATNPRFRQLRTEHHRLLARKIRRGIESSVDPAHIEGLDLDVLANILAGMLEAACRVNFREGPRQDVDVLTDHIATVWGRALGYIDAETVAHAAAVHAES